MNGYIDSRYIDSRYIVNGQVEGGFTLLELVASILLLGILGAFSYQFFTFGVVSYVDMASRDKTTDQGRFIVDRMSRELVNALPNSVRIIQNDTPTIKCIEFMPVNAATGYLSIPMIPATNKIQAITFDLPPGNANSYLAAVFTNDTCDVYGVKADGSSCDKTGDGNTNSADRAWHPISSWSPTSSQVVNISLGSNVSYLQESPSKRLYITSQPIAFCFHNSGELRRYSHYTFNYPHQFFASNSPPAGGVLMGENIDFDNSSFVFDAESHIRNAIIQINIVITNHDGSEDYPFNHQVSLHNAP